MKKSLTRGVLAGAAAAVLAGGALTAVPAHAGGPGSKQVSAPTKAACTAERDALRTAAVAAGGKVTGVYSCFKSGNTWYGGFVVNY